MGEYIHNYADGLVLIQKSSPLTFQSEYITKNAIS